MKKVLVADDTKNIRLLLKTCLEIEGYDVTLASDGNQALELIKGNSFDLAFIDIKMPEITGTEVLRRIREYGNTMPVIIMTAYGTIKNAIECTRLGAVSYLQKPFTADKVKTVLAELIKNDSNDNLSTDNSNENKPLDTDILDTAVLDKAEAFIKANDFIQALDLLKSSTITLLENERTYLLLSKACEGIGNKENSEKFYKIYATLKNLHK